MAHPDLPSSSEEPTPVAASDATAERPDPAARASRGRTIAAKPEDQSVAKANEAIAIRPKRGRLTLLSRRIYNVFLYHAQKQGVDNPQYTLPLAELIDDARFTSHNTELLKSHIRDMQATTIEWHTGTEGQRRWTSTQLLGTVTIDEPGRGRACTITWTYPEPIREQLVKPSRYTRILLEMSSQMRSYAAAVLYELGARYLTSPARLTMREDVLWWASVLTGRSDLTTVDYRILHRDTIKKALVELDTLCDEFRLELVEHRRGRKVEELQFRVVPKAQPSLHGLNEGAKNTFDLQLVARLEALGFKRQDAEDTYAMTDEGVLRATLDHVEQRLKNPALEPLKSPAAYLRDALKKQYAGAADSTGPAAAAEPPPPALQDRKLQLLEDVKLQRLAEARALFAEMTDAAQQGHITRFEAERLPDLASPIARAWREGGTRSRIAASTFYRWLAEQLWPGPISDKDLLEFMMRRQG